MNNTEPIINADRLSAEAMYEKKRLFTDCVKLSVLLILYNLLNRIFSYVFFYGAYFYHSGKFTFSYGKVISYLRQQREFVSSTVFNMTANLFITLCSFVLIFIVYSLLFRGRIKAYLSPGVKKGALGLKWFPACFVINILLTQFMLILTGILGANGVSVPTSDFSIKHMEGDVVHGGQAAKLHTDIFFEPLAQTTEFEAGTVVEVSKHELILAAAENTTYSVKILQPAGKPKLKITDYLNGVGQGLKVQTGHV